jgi:hypothetical protein
MTDLGIPNMELVNPTKPKFLRKFDLAKFSLHFGLADLPWEFCLAEIQ